MRLLVIRLEFRSEALAGSIEQLIYNIAAQPNMFICFGKRPINSAESVPCIPCVVSDSFRKIVIVFRMGMCVCALA